MLKQKTTCFAKSGLTGCFVVGFQIVYLPQIMKIYYPKRYVHAITAKRTPAVSAVIAVIMA